MILFSGITLSYIGTPLYNHIHQPLILILDTPILWFWLSSFKILGEVGKDCVEVVF